jgi:Fe-S-cluster-containing hydrogenase component 2
MAKKNKLDSSSSDIFQLLLETAERERKQRREELLAPLGVKEFFVDGSITIDKRTCKGVECKLCIKACPTNALFWKTGEVGIIRELCIYCGACVLSCIVDDCIKVSRKRTNGEVEAFSTPRDVIILQNSINAKKRLERIKSIFPTFEEYLRRYKPSMAT